MLKIMRAKVYFHISSISFSMVLPNKNIRQNNYASFVFKIDLIK